MIHLGIFKLLDFPVGPSDCELFDLCRRSEPDILFDGAGAHESASWEDVACELPVAGIDGESAANTAAVAVLSNERQDHAAALCHAVLEQSQWPPSNRADQ